MKIFVTGGSGFIGNSLVDMLLKRDHELVCLAIENDPRIAYLRKPRVEIVYGDTRDKDTLKPMEGCDAVMANAAIYKFGPPKHVRKILYDVNVNGNINTIEKALEYGIPKIVYTSSIQALGNTPRLVDEDYVHERIPEFSTLYEKTKYDGHMYCLKMIEDQGAPITLGMPTAAFGEDDPSDIGISLRDMVLGELFALPHVEAKINFIHVEDTSEGLVLCLEKGKHGAYLLGGPVGNNITLEEFFMKMAELGGIEPPKRRVSLGTMKFLEKLLRIKGFLTRKRQVFNKEVIANFEFNSLVTCEKAFKELDYKPRPLEERMKETINWFVQKFKPEN